MPDAPETAGLSRHLANLIASEGAIGVDRYMAEALGNPRWGYYKTRDPFGLEGDFITAPEVSQMFGELIGLWCAATWQQMGAPAEFRLVEIGPGRGTLMADALRAARLMPPFLAAARLHLVETSPVLRELQGSALADHQVAWHDHVNELPSGPAIVVANELFDALPIRQFERTLEGWRERLVGLAPDGGLRFVRAAGPSPAEALIPEEVRQAPLASVAEISPASITLIRDLTERLLAAGGAALIVDYGTDESRPRDTLQAVIGHKTHPVLEAPGSADLCAHVDFAQLGRTARECGAQVHGPTGQGEFLERLGIRERAARLQAGADASRAEDIDAALTRLTHPGQMGSHFRVLALTPPGAPEPAGFEVGACGGKT
jgi:NADH dehydrogenase [ubiquinone] 1 alpha subcomplex assembly factor 7